MIVSRLAKDIKVFVADSFMVTDKRMDAENKQRRQDVMERLRIRFTQYQKRQNEYLTRFMGNGPVKEERERQDTQLYQQRILNTRTSTKPRAKQDQGGKTSAIEQAYQSNAMGDPLILQVCIISVQLHIAQDFHGHLFPLLISEYLSPVVNENCKHKYYYIVLLGQ